MSILAEIDRYPKLRFYETINYEFNDLEEIISQLCQRCTLGSSHYVGTSSDILVIVDGPIYFQLCCIPKVVEDERISYFVQTDWDKKNNVLQ